MSDKERSELQNALRKSLREQADRLNNKPQFRNYVREKGTLRSIARHA